MKNKGFIFLGVRMRKWDPAICQNAGSLKGNYISAGAHPGSLQVNKKSELCSSSKVSVFSLWWNKQRHLLVKFIAGLNIPFNVKQELFEATILFYDVVVLINLRDNQCENFLVACLKILAIFFVKNSFSDEVNLKRSRSIIEGFRTK
jgi:hypothetical protein